MEGERRGGGYFRAGQVDGAGLRLGAAGEPWAILCRVWFRFGCHGAAGEFDDLAGEHFAGALCKRDSHRLAEPHAVAFFGADF